jgi:hypothetical protein
MWWGKAAGFHIIVHVVFSAYEAGKLILRKHVDTRFWEYNIKENIWIRDRESKGILQQSKNEEEINFSSSRQEVIFTVLEPRH